MHKTIIHIIRDKSKNTKKDVETFRDLTDQGYEVMDVFNYKNQYYYIMQKHLHEEEELTN